MELATIRQETPKRKKDGYLHLIAIGTLPSYQGQGLARAMLHFIRQMAEKKGAKGILLDTHSDNPACHLYLKEGYIVEREFRLGTKGLVWMRPVDCAMAKQAILPTSLEALCRTGTEGMRHCSKATALYVANAPSDRVRMKILEGSRSKKGLMLRNTLDLCRYIDK